MTVPPLNHSHPHLGSANTSVPVREGQGWLGFTRPWDARQHSNWYNISFDKRSSSSLGFWWTAVLCTVTFLLLRDTIAGVVTRQHAARKSSHQRFFSFSTHPAPPCYNSHPKAHKDIHTYVYTCSNTHTHTSVRRHKLTPRTQTNWRIPHTRTSSKTLGE